MFNTNDRVKAQVFGREFEGTVQDSSELDLAEWEIVVDIPHVGQIVTVPEALELVEAAS